MPTGAPRCVDEGEYTTEEMTQLILQNQFFGVVEVDIHTPDHLKDKFSELAPIFKKATIDPSVLSMWDQPLFDKPSRKLINSYFATDMAFITPLLKWYLQKGLVITNVCRAIEYKPSACFEWFGKGVTEARSAADANAAMRPIGDMMKLMGSGGYGYAMMDKSKHEKCEIVDIPDYRKKVNSPLYKSQEVLEDGSIELHRTKKYAKADLHLQMSFFVYGYAK